MVSMYNSKSERKLTSGAAAGEEGTVAEAGTGDVGAGMAEAAVEVD